MWTIIIAAISVVFDQITKFYVIRDLMPVKDSPIWEGVLHLHYAENTGAAFGMLPGLRWVFLIVACLFVIATFYFVLFYKKKKIDTMALISLGLITGGAIGNIIDRLRLGYVVDFIYVKIINFAIFNVADSCVVVGAILLGIYAIFIYKEPEKSEIKEKVSNE
jgi:signal peptidase II